MSVYRARSRENGIDVDYGFFDSDNEVVIVQGSDDYLDAMVVVEHELVHVNLADNSSLGLIEQALTALHTFMILPNLRSHGQDLLAKRSACLDRLGRLRAASGVVHEGVAWFCTELLTLGRENKSAPSQYRKTIATLRDALSDIQGLDRPGTDQYFQDAVHIGEALAIVALSPGNVGDVVSASFHDDDARAVARLRQLLSADGMAPTERFALGCQAIRKLDRDAAIGWADGVFAHGETNPIELLASNSKKLRRMTFGSLESIKEIVRGSLRSYAEKHLLAGTASPDIDQFWSNHLILGRFQKALDRYSQTCVLGARLLTNDLKYGSDTFGDRPAPDFLLSSAVVVTRAVSGDDDRTGWLKPEAGPLVALFGVRIAAHFPWMETKDNLISRWVTEVGDAEAYLREVAADAGQPIVAVGVGYDDNVGDFKGVSLLRNAPHVVFEIGSFWNWWKHVALSASAERGGPVAYEWLAMRSPSGNDSPFGYIIVKSTERRWPIVMIPTCIDKVERVVSVAEAVPSPYGVTLKVAETAPFEWLGPLAKFPSAAAQAYEAVSC